MALLGDTPTFDNLEPQGPPTRKVSSGSVSHPQDVARKARYRPSGPPTRRVRVRKTARNPASLAF